MKTEEQKAIANRLGEIVRKQRLMIGWSYYELSKRSGIHVSQLINIESGNHCPRLDTLIKLASTLRIQLRLPNMDLI